MNAALGKRRNQRIFAAGDRTPAFPVYVFHVHATPAERSSTSHETSADACTDLKSRFGVSYDACEFSRVPECEPRKSEMIGGLM